MTTTVGVELHGRLVGELRDDGESTVFRFFRSYWDDPDRPVLGQWFEDGGPDEVYSGPGRLPAFFANLEPEGGLARWLARRNRIGSGDLDLLTVAGADLAGAVVLRSAAEHRARDAVSPRPAATPSFGLAGVQLKLPMSLDRDDRLTLPMGGVLAGWFLKVPSRGKFRGIAENEAGSLAWARAAHFDAAEARVHPLPEGIVDAADEVADDERCLLVRRYDRDAQGKAVHQEDLAQLQWLDPQQKYPWSRVDPGRLDAGSEARRDCLATVEGLGRFAMDLLGPPGFEEYVRRTVFVVALGNGDAHLKNWSVLYPDRRTPVWTPLYDQVSTIAWGLNTLALPFFGAVNFPAVSRQHFARLAAVCGHAEERAGALVDETLERLRAAWPGVEDRFPHQHRAMIRAQWRKVALLKPFAPLC